MAYKVAGDFNKAPLGPFTNANKKLVWGPIQSDFDPQGSLFSIVADDRFEGGRACRMKYPKGGVGMNDQQYYFKLAAPEDPVWLEFDWLFEKNFSFHTPNTNKTCGGKIGPCVQWGLIDGPEEGTRAMIWWNGSGSNYPAAGQNPVFSPSCQDQASGKQWIQPVKYTARIELERLYHWKIGIQGGPNGWAKYFLDGNLLAEVPPSTLRFKAADDVFIDFAFFSGGATHPDNETEWDSYARHGNVRYWTGASSEWDAGNGDGGDTGEGGGTTPTPPAGVSSVSATVVIDGIAYKGELTRE